MTLDLLRDDFEHALDTDPARAHTLPARYYLDPEVFEREKSAIFYRHWHYIGHLSQLEKAGDYLTARIADEPVFVMRGEDGTLRGFYNVCRHRAHELLEGSGRVDAIVCPYHAWTYPTAATAACATPATRTRSRDSTTAPSAFRRSGSRPSVASCSSTWTTMPSPWPR